MAGIFKANNPFNTFLLFVYGIVLKLSWFYHPSDPVTGKFDGFLYRLIFPELLHLKVTSTFFYDTIIYFFLFIQAVIFNRLIVNQRYMQKANYLPGMSYLLLTSLFNCFNVLSSVLFVNTLFIWAFAKMNKLFNAANPKVAIYNIGLIVGMASFFFVPAIGFLLLALIALIITRPFRLREWVLLFIGAITPYYFLLCQIYLQTGRVSSFIFPLLMPVLPQYYFSKLQLILVVFLFLLFIIGFYYVYNTLRKQVVQVRKSWTILFFYVIISVIIYGCYSGNLHAYGLLTLIPLSVYIAGFFFYPKNNLLLIAGHWLLVAFIIYTGYIIR